MASKLLIAHLLIFSLSGLPSNGEQWIKAGYWYTGSELPSQDINSALFTHLFCAFAGVNNSTYELSLPSSDTQRFSSFPINIKHKNPSAKALLSIWAGQEPTASSMAGNIPNSTVLSSMVASVSHRSSFIDSSIRTARLFGFDGMDLFWVWPGSSSDLAYMGTLLDEWRSRIDSEAKNSNKSKLILTVALHYLPTLRSAIYPVDSIRRNVDWAHVVAYDYYLSKSVNFTHAHAALYDPKSKISTDFGIREWISKGLQARKMVLGLPYHGYSWKLVDPKKNGIGAPASGPAITLGGDMAYKFIKYFIRSYAYGAVSVYNSTYVVNYCILGSDWIGYDDVDAIRAKVLYAKQKSLIGYNVFQVANDENWALSIAAQGGDADKGISKKLLLVILLPVALAFLLILSGIACYRWRTVTKARVMKESEKGSLHGGEAETFATGTFNNAPNLQVLSFADVKVATDNFSAGNILGEGGFGPVYKGKLERGQEIAVKRLSKDSDQGAEEFKNEMMLTARLQHVNLLRVLGFCSEGDEKMLIYEYMPNGSLDVYLFDPVRRYTLDWEKRVRIIEGIIQALLYLQEYSNYIIIHRDLKSSNILLDNEMNPKISDFGMARIFRKEEQEANTSRIVGTYGYIPPEYVRKGVYSRKHDVYSFGVLLLQIISSKRNGCYYGLYENLSLLEYAYESWKNDGGMEFIDRSLDDSCSSYKTMRCLQIGLLCVQENPADRPSMLEVFSILNNEAAPVCTPRKPAFSVNKDDEEEAITTSEMPHDAFSVATSSITRMLPR